LYYNVTKTYHIFTKKSKEWHLIKLGKWTPVMRLTASRL